jgi:glycosyltransferase involved in cell wall biosynthesis
MRFRVHFCGDGPDKSYLINLIEDFGLVDYITFHGDVANIYPYYEMCNFVVIPSIHESFGYVALEAVSFGRPVIASHVGGLREIIVDKYTGYSFRAGDHIELARKILELLASKEKTTQYTNNAKLYVMNKFNLTKQLSSLMSIYQKLMRTSSK